MREIKFRAWIKKFKEMHGVRQVNFTQELVWFTEKWNEALELQFVELMQYTGLKDKNGKEIYEGDILKNKGVSVVKSIEDIHQVIGFRDAKENNPHSEPQTTIETFESQFEIIGNIYENPGLVKCTSKT